MLFLHIRAGRPTFVVWELSGGPRLSGLQRQAIRFLIFLGILQLHFWCSEAIGISFSFISTCFLLLSYSSMPLG